MGRKFFGSSGVLPGFRRAMIFDFLQVLGICPVLVILLKRSRSHVLAIGPKFFICSVQISSTPADFLFFSSSMAVWSSRGEKWSLSIDSSTRCFLSSVHLCFFFLFVLPFMSSWCATWFAVTADVCVLDSDGSQSSFLMSPTLYYCCVSCPHYWEVCAILSFLPL